MRSVAVVAAVLLANVDTAEGGLALSLLLFVAR